MNIDLTPKFLELQAFKPPTIGRYSISGLYGVLAGYDTPEQFLKGKQIDFPTALKMRMGSLKHELCQEYLEGWDIEKKIEFFIPDTDIVLVGKCDAYQDDTILEIKTSDTLLLKAKKWHEWQLKMYLSMFNAEKGVIVQPIIMNGLFLKVIGEVKKNMKWFEKELEKIVKLHQQLCQLQK